MEHYLNEFLDKLSENLTENDIALILEDSEENISLYDEKYFDIYIYDEFSPLSFSEIEQGHFTDMGYYKTLDGKYIMEQNESLYVVLFKSRNKDNKHLEGFKERSNSFVSTKSYVDLLPDFKSFVEKGVSGELCRMYMSINPRSNTKTFKALQHKMIDGEFNLASLPQKVASITALKGNAEDSKNLKWLFDFDPTPDKDLKDSVKEFIEDVKSCYENTERNNSEPIGIEIRRTLNEYAIITDKRFDTRWLLNKWKNVELKRDAMLCCNWDTKK